MKQWIVVAIVLLVAAAPGWSQKVSRQAELVESLKVRLSQITKLQTDILDQVIAATNALYNSITVTNTVKVEVKVPVEVKTPIYVTNVVTVQIPVYVTNVVTVQTPSKEEKKEEKKDDSKNALSDDNLKKFISQLEAIPAPKRGDAARGFISENYFKTAQAVMLLSRIPTDEERLAALQLIGPRILDKENKMQLVLNIRWEKLRGAAMKFIDSW